MGKLNDLLSSMIDRLNNSVRFDKRQSLTGDQQRTVRDSIDAPSNIDLSELEFGFDQVLKAGYALTSANAIKWNGVIGNKPYISALTDAQISICAVKVAEIPAFIKTAKDAGEDVGGTITGMPMLVSICNMIELGDVTFYEFSFDSIIEEVIPNKMYACDEVFIVLEACEDEDISVHFDSPGVYFMSYSLINAGLDMSALFVSSAYAPLFTGNEDKSVTSWNDLEDKPFGVERKGVSASGDTLSWDGTPTNVCITPPGLPAGTVVMACHVADDIPMLDDFNDGCVITVNVGGDDDMALPFSKDEIAFHEDQNVITISSGTSFFFVTLNDNCEAPLFGMVFPKAGIYFLNVNEPVSGLTLVTKSLTINGYEFKSQIKKIDEKFLPEEPPAVLDFADFGMDMNVAFNNFMMGKNCTVYEGRAFLDYLDANYTSKDSLPRLTDSTFGCEMTITSYVPGSQLSVMVSGIMGGSSDTVMYFSGDILLMSGVFFNDALLAPHSLVYINVTMKELQKPSIE